MDLIPLPKSYTEKGGRFPVAPAIRCSDEALLPAAKVFAGYAKKAFGRAWSLGSSENGVELRLCASLAEEGYTLSADGRRVVISASALAGANRALATLMQLLDDGLTLPECEISDAPDCEYRAYMADVANDRHELEWLLGYLDMCWFYKIGMLHIHFTDNRIYSLPSRLFPRLSSEGHYTFEQLGRLVDYAAERGIQLVPEIDVPGHSAHFRNYPEIFGSEDIIMQTEGSMAAMSALFGELCELFPNSRFIHIGGDEAEISLWCEGEKCREYALSCGINFDMPDRRLLAERLLANFVQKMADAVLAHGRRPIVWEGFAPSVNEFVSRDITVVSWENYYQLIPQLLDAGFTVINGSWAPMYIVAPETRWTQEEVFNWSIFRWRPVHPQSPYLHMTVETDPNELVTGGSLIAWGYGKCASEEERLELLTAERGYAEERAPMLAENTWNKAKRRSYEDIARAYAACSRRYLPMCGRA